MQPQFASAGNAMERGAREHELGLYYHDGSKTYIGVIDENQASAAIRVGYKLIKVAATSAEATEMSKEVNLPKTAAPVIKEEEK